MIGISDLEYLCAEVRQIARKAGAFCVMNGKRFDRERVEEKSAHNYVSYVDKESERRLVEQLRHCFPSWVYCRRGFGKPDGRGVLLGDRSARRDLQLYP